MDSQPLLRDRLLSVALRSVNVSGKDESGLGWKCGRRTWILKQYREPGHSQTISVQLIRRWLLAHRLSNFFVTRLGWLGLAGQQFLDCDWVSTHLTRDRMASVSLVVETEFG